MEYIKEFALFKSKFKSVCDELKKNPNIEIDKIDSSLLKENVIKLKYNSEKFKLQFGKEGIYITHIDWPPPPSRDLSYGPHGNVMYQDDIKNLSKSIVDTFDNILKNEKSLKNKSDELQDFFNELSKDEINDMLIDIGDLDLIEKIFIEKTDQYSNRNEDCIGWHILFTLKNGYKMQQILPSDKVYEYGSFVLLVSEFMKRIESGWGVKVTMDNSEGHLVRIIKSIPR